ncbi:MAG: UDP-4-amino-4,6-dideoxy-N-acetyl-beta-L-altrosamine N-acetyltransferase [Proteobacteria bacterium]|nr:UDP-4-amino-4,6-dideoxy-N-acetyl-beta-L-altrosamine N-acetyltransferase [Pseudomonadota bacterium]
MLRFSKLMENDLELVLKWRTQPDVTRYMNNDIEFNMANQKLWFDRLALDASSKHWLISMDERPVGVINLAGLDFSHRRCSIGYYIGEASCRAMGFMIPPYLYNFIFNNLKLNKIYGEVLEGNGNLLKMHKLHGWRVVGVLKEHVFKYGSFHDVTVVELLAADWHTLRPKYSNFTADFEL